MAQTTFIAVRRQWRGAWSSRGFRIKMIIGTILLTGTMCSMPFFFQWIQGRPGTPLPDPILQWLPAVNVSLPLFILIWSLSALAIVRAIRTPHILLVFIWSYILLTLMRMATITLLPLEPPIHLINLVDPLSNFFYGPKFITKDLFPSGHTSTMFLLYFCLQAKGDRRIALVITFAVAILLLVQHVHYTVDILGGFLYGWLAWWIVVHSVAKN